MDTNILDDRRTHVAEVLTEEIMQAIWPWLNLSPEADAYFYARRKIFELLHKANLEIIS